MSIIQTIRDKYAKWAVVGIALAILGFLLMDASVGRSRLFAGGGQGTVGSVNGKKISYEDFAEKVQIAERNIEASQKGIAAETKRGQAIEGVWAEEVNKIIYDAEFSKLGISISENELADMIGGARPTQTAQQYLGQQGQPYNGQQALQLVRQVQKGKNAEDKKRLEDLLEYMRRERLIEKYNSLFDKALNIPRWVIEAKNADDSRIANVSYISIPYNDSALLPHDTAIKVTDEEIMNYVKNHKSQFKQKESRNISYVAFSFNPSAADSLYAKEKVQSLAEKFRDAADAKAFLDREGTDMLSDMTFVKADAIQQAAKDSILKLPVGGTYGPYLDGPQYVIAKLVDSKMVPDSVTVRHILVQTAQMNPQNGQLTPIRDTTDARKFLNDSVLSLLNSGVAFDSVCRRYSEDGGSKDSGGVYKNVPWGRMVPEFNEFIFTKGPGVKGVVYTQYGFHYIEVLKHMGNADERVVKTGFLSRSIVTSQKTEDDASERANNFAGKIKNQKEFDDVYEKELKPSGLNKGQYPGVIPGMYSVGALGDSWEFVKKIYAAKKDEIIKPEKVGTNFVVAVVTEVFEEGTQNAATARLDRRIEGKLKNSKRAEIIKKKLGSATTLEAAAAALNKKIETADSVGIMNRKLNFAFEIKLLGAVFNPANKGKFVTEVIEGNGGLYLVQVNSTGTQPLLNVNVTQQRQQAVEQRKYSRQNKPIVVKLKEAANIKDRRVSKF